ncbi:MAG TPA: transcriptional coactivator p15/PC4 family protein [Limnochordia bacterium]|nr:transcriptional coactivator p15/PC4 family protein [Limnochordia bacterium]
MGKVIELEKGRGQVVRVQTTQYAGYQLIDARIWYEDEDGEWKPTRKGVALAPWLACQMAQAILQLVENETSCTL